MRKAKPGRIFPVLPFKTLNNDERKLLKHKNT